MTNYLNQLWQRLFPKPTLQAVLSNFERTIVDLEGVIAESQSRVTVIADQMSALAQERLKLRDDIDRAASVSKNIAALIKG